jgi:hypothetical protein
LWRELSVLLFDIGKIDIILYDEKNLKTFLEGKANSFYDLLKLTFKNLIVVQSFDN